MTSAVDFKMSGAITGLARASFFVILAFLLVGCDCGPANLQLSGSTMGTSYKVTLVTDQPLPADLASRVESLLEEVNQRMSTYREDSELSRLNRQALGEPLTVSEMLWDVLSLSSQVYVLSGATFDPGIGNLVELWGFGAAPGSNSSPSDEAINRQLEVSGLQYLEYGDGRTVTRHRDIRLDLSAIAKGYAVDLVADYLESQAVTNYLVEVGGEMRLSGQNHNGTPWRVAIEKPEISGGVERVLLLDQGAVATSGDYRNYFEQDGTRYSHTLDPLTGKPITHNLASVTVLTDRCATADALATALTVMGPELALKNAERWDIPVYLLVREGDSFRAMYSSKFADFLEQ